MLSGDESSAERVLGGSVTPDLFPMLGIEPFMGRQFRPEEAAAPGLESVVMLTHGLWQRRYGIRSGDHRQVDHRQRSRAGRDRRAAARDQVSADRPALHAVSLGRIAAIGAQHQRVALLKPGRDDRASSSAELSSSRSGSRSSIPITNRGYGVQVVPIRRSYVDAGVDRMGVILMTAVGFVLLIMCANLANLMLVRGASRQRELAVRAAMGASRGRLLWATLSESVLLAVPGTLIGLIASQWAIDWMIGVVSGRAAVLVHLQHRLARRAVHDRRSRSSRRSRSACCRRFAPPSRISSTI